KRGADRDGLLRIGLSRSKVARLRLRRQLHLCSSSAGESAAMVAQENFVPANRISAVMPDEGV
ncbi:hypothetical protein NYQ83_17625, partial [Afifella sp. JA880]|uniref:hypothetical protein n=1 Tax=Afifella sp. JA880 TaxID=2975280 RepID=UPI0021BBB533